MVGAACPGVFSSRCLHIRLLLPEQWRGQEIIAFLGIIEPLISQSCDRLHQGVQALVQRQSDLPFDPSTVEAILLANLPGPLLRMLNRTLVLELHVARLQGLLEGDTPEERFQSFLQHLASPRSPSPCSTNIPSWPAS